MFAILLSLPRLFDVLIIAALALFVLLIIAPLWTPSVLRVSWRRGLGWYRWHPLTFGALMALALAGCASTTPNVALYETTGALTTAMTIATTYAQLPSCAPGSPVICSDPATVSRIQTAAAGAVAADQTAQTVVTDPATSAAAKQQAVASAAVALAALTTITSTVRTH